MVTLEDSLEHAKVLKSEIDEVKLSLSMGCDECRCNGLLSALQNNKRQKLRVQSTKINAVGLLILCVIFAYN